MITQFITSLALFGGIILSSPAIEASSEKTKASGNLKRVFLNASKNKNGVTASYAKKIYSGLKYETIDLVDYKISQIGQPSSDDQFFKVIEKLSNADVIVIGTPVYWSDMTGYLKTFIDRLADIMEVPLDSKNAPLNGADLYLIIQGSEPTDAIPGITTVIKHIAKRFFMNFKGTALNDKDARKINTQLKNI